MASSANGFASSWSVNNTNWIRGYFFIAKRDYIVPKGEKVEINIPVIGSVGRTGEALTGGQILAYALAIKLHDEEKDDDDENLYRKHPPKALREM